MKRMILVIAGCLALSACGLGETAISAAAAGSGEAAQAKDALKTEARVKEQLDAATKLETQHRQDAENSAQ